MLRVHYWENRDNGGIPWKRMAEAHRRQRAASVHLVRAVVMRPWLDGHIATIVNAVTATAARTGVHISAARDRRSKNSHSAGAAPSQSD